MECHENTITKRDSLALGEPQSPEDEEICPTCNGNGSISRTKSSQSNNISTKEPFKFPSTFSESALSPIRVVQRPRTTQIPVTHERFLNDSEVFNQRETDRCTKIVNFSEKTLKRAVMKLSHREFETKKKGLEECLGIAQSYPGDIELHMNLIYRTMKTMLFASRPKDAAFVCELARQYFTTMRSSCRPEFDHIVLALLLRTGDGNFTVRCYANNALEKIVTCVPTQHALRPLLQQGCKHKNHVVRTAAVGLISDIITYRTPSALLTSPNLRESCQKIIEGTAKILVDSSLEARAAAKHLFLKLVDIEEFDSVYECCEIDRDVKKSVDEALHVLKEQCERYRDV